MASATYRPNSEALNKVAGSPQMGAALTRWAESKVPLIQGVAPVKTGAYKASIRARPAVVHTPFVKSPKSPKERNGAVIEVTVPYAVSVEWGTGEAIGIRKKARRRRGHLVPMKLQRRGAQHVLGNATKLLKGAL
ncbi:MAG: hypothetical protein MSC45_00105 [Mobiluncus sp.]|uniref:hypothetical protein n=1 Tax=Mobiluncus sp. TaxID=47293 RepID=UPI002590CA4C|nr:hypothetical protein [Mobiluncus sp.]MCI6583457.1 hypothetical protein [Mobiluncus sp.]